MIDILATITSGKTTLLGGLRFTSGGSSRTSGEANSVYNSSEEAKAAVRETDESPTAGKNIPIILGATRLTGDVIWIRTFLNSKNECRAHVAVCFGVNMFQRPLGLMAVTQGNSYIYRRAGGEVVDPPSAVRFYDGTHTSADPKIIEYEGASNTPAFKGYIYAVLENVKLGDFGAEFTDEAIEEPIQTGGNVSFACSNDLAGISLVYDFETGMHYGIRDPLTTESYLVRSPDGCRIFDERRISLGPEYSPPNIYPFRDTRFYPNLHPIRCSRALAFPNMDYGGLNGQNEILYRPFLNLMPDPDVATVYDTVEEYWLSKDSYWGVTAIPPEPVADIIESYPRPGTRSSFILLRLYDPSDTLFEGNSTQSLGTGNIAATILDTTNGPASIWNDAEELNTVPTPNGISYFPYIGWDVSNTPVVDDIIYGKTDDATVRLAGVKVTGPTVTVFRIEHTVNGMTNPVTVNLTLPEQLSYSGIQYDKRSDKVLLSASGSLPNTLVPSRIYKISLDGDVSYTSVGPGLRIVNRKYAQEFNGLVVLASENFGELYTFDAETDETALIWSGDEPSDTPVVDLSRNKIFIPTLTGYSTYTASQIAPGQIPLIQLLTDCCTIKGYTPSDLVFENLETETVLGMQISSTIRLSDLFNRLGTLYGFVFVETDQKLKFVKKRINDSLSIDVVLTENDLVLSSSGDQHFSRAVQRNGSNNLLGGMNLEFVNPDKNYENDTIMVRRPVGSFDTGASARIETLSVPVTLDPADAYRLMYESFYTILQRQTRAAFSVLSWSAALEPGDCVSVDVDGIETTGIAVRVTMREDFAQDVEIEVFHEGGSTTLSEPVGYDPVLENTDLVGWYIPLEIPFIRASDYVDANTTVRYHGMASTEPGAWAWADLYRSIDGSTFTKVLDYDRQPMTVGRATTVLGAAPMRYALDEANSVTISVLSGSASDFVSASYVEQANGANLCAFGQAGRWEILSFQTVQENSDGTLTLSGLQRGLFGTAMLYDPDDFGLEHAVNDILVLLDPVKLYTTPYLASDYGLAETFAIKTSGVDLSQTRVTSGFENTAMRAFQPASVQVLHYAGSNDLLITWEHTTAVPSIWSDSGGEAPMHVPVTYSIEIQTTAGNFEFTTTDRTYTWTAYGAELGATSNAEEEVFGVSLIPRNDVIGEGFEVYAAATEI